MNLVEVNSLEDLQKVVATGESETVEFKKTTAQLPRAGETILRNPLIAQTFHRTGAVETWGRGTNRVIDECRGFGVEPPVFELRSNSLVVTFRATIGLGPNLVPERDQVGTKSAPSPGPQQMHEQSGDCCTHGSHRKDRPHQIQKADPRATDGTRPDRDDHPGQASQLKTRVPHNRRRSPTTGRGG